MFKLLLGKGGYRFEGEKGDYTCSWSWNAVFAGDESTTKRNATDC